MANPNINKKEYGRLQQAWRQQASLCRKRRKRIACKNWREADKLTARIDLNAARLRGLLKPVILE